MAEPWSDGDVLTAAHLAGMPWGVVGYATKTADQTGITTLADVTSLSVTFTAVSTRLYRTTVWMRGSQLGGSAGTVSATIADGASVEKARVATSIISAGFAALHVVLIETGISGSITRKARADTTAGTLSILGAAAGASLIIVEDCAAG
jgi:hypothetical protein